MNHDKRHPEEPYRQPSPKLEKLSGKLPRRLIAMSVVVPLLMLLILALASLLPYPPEPTHTIIGHLLGR